MDWTHSVGDGHAEGSYDQEWVGYGIDGTLYTVEQYGEDRQFHAGAVFGTVDNPEDKYLGGFATSKAARLACEAAERWQVRMAERQAEVYG